MSVTPSVFVPAALFAVVCVAAKAALLDGVPAAVGWGDVLASTGEDIAAAMVLGLTGWAALRVTQRAPVLRRAAWGGYVALSTMGATFAVANIEVYGYFRRPLTLPILTMTQRLDNMASSFAETVSVRVLVMLAAVAVGLPLASRWRAGVVSPRVRVAAMTAGLAWVCGGVAMRWGVAPDSWQQRLGSNPHRAFAASVIERLMWRGSVELTEAFPAEFLDDFRLAAQRRRGPIEGMERPPRHVIVVVLESVGARYMSLYGYEKDTTPSLVKAARHAAVYEGFYAHEGYTFCSMVPLVYGAHPGLPWCWRPTGERPMPEAMAAVLGRRGYRTAFVMAGDGEWGGMTLMARRAGFEHVADQGDLSGAPVSSWGKADGAAVDALVSWIDRELGRPFYAVLWTDQTHHPYVLSPGVEEAEFITPRPHPRQVLLNRYLNALREADRQVGRLLEALERRGLGEETLVVVTGDHGEAFGDAHDVMGHGTELYEENVRVPLMLWNPRLFPTGRREKIVGGHVDLNPTLAHILGVDPPADWQGASLMSDDHPGRVYLVVDVAEFQIGVRDERYKYVMNLAGAYERLYDLEEDPGERRDISREQPGITRVMRQRAAAFVAAESDYLFPKRRSAAGAGAATPAGP